MNHEFTKKEIEPGTDFIVEECVCGQLRRRYRSTRVTYQQSDGSFKAHKTECYGKITIPVAERIVKTFSPSPPLIEALAIMRLLIEDPERGKVCARNFFQSYAV